MKEMAKIQKTVKGILSDIDGTLFFKGVPTPGAIEAVLELKKKKKVLFLTNTDSKTPDSVHKKLINLGFSIQKNEIFTPIIAIKNFLKKTINKKLFLVTSKEIEGEFKEFDVVSKKEIPDYVIISDFTDNWDVNRLNIAFKYLLKGAKLFGTQGNRYCLNDKGEPVIDTGSFVMMLAHAANVQYKIFGKPSKDFFNHALEKINLKAKECLVIGDDIESDIKGATNAGIKAVLVKTGKASYYEGSYDKTLSVPVISNFKAILNII
jgi:HAD superfamily hydrolase (TIGR01458 family)